MTFAMTQDEQFILDLVFMFSYEGFEVTLQMLQYVNKKVTFFD